MSIFDILSRLLEMFADLIILPIDYVLEIYNSTSLSDYNFKMGFGSVEWFNFPLSELVIIVLGLILGFIILRLLYRFIKWLFRLGKGLIGIR